MSKKQRGRPALPAEHQPPEELRALCALSDIHIEYVPGRPARTWRLSLANTTPPGTPKFVTLQSVQYDDWAQAVKTLLG